MQRKNEDIRSILKTHGLTMWQVAERLNISEWTFTRWLRYDLAFERRNRIINAINELSCETQERRSK